MIIQGIRRLSQTSCCPSYTTFSFTLKTSKMDFPDPVGIENAQEHCQIPSELGDTTM